MSLFQTTVTVHPGDLLMMLRRCEDPWDFVGAPDQEYGELELIWRPDFEAPQVRLTLMKDGTWSARFIVTVGDE